MAGKRDTVQICVGRLQRRRGRILEQQVRVRGDPQEIQQILETHSEAMRPVSL